MSHVPIVSVVIPAYNQAPLLRLAVESALHQTLSDLEVIIVDDGSTDDTRAVCESLRDPRVRYLHQVNDGTHGLGARNWAMLESRAEWIALLDQDDVWSPTKLERQLDHAARHPNAGLVFCLARFIDENGQCTGQQRSDVPEGDAYPKLLGRNWYYASTGVFRRRLLALAGLPAHGAGSGDRQLWLALTRHTQVAVVREFLCDYRFHSANYSMSVLARPDASLRVAMSRWHLTAAQQSLVPMDRPEYQRALGRAQRKNSKRFFDVALAAAGRRDQDTLRQSLQMARVAAPEYSRRPAVILKRAWRLLRARLSARVRQN
ncbi:MAG: glycosyltransferase family 2 protein [Panacagrimonas sp.]